MNAGPRRLVLFAVAMFICLGILFVGAAGILRPAENIASAPLSILQRISSGLSQSVSDTLNTLSDLQNLQRRVVDLERALVNTTREIVELREIRADYERLAALANFNGAGTDWQTVTATVIGRDPTGIRRTLTIDRGTRDGLVPGLPVITELGLVGRVGRVGAISAQIDLVIDVSSYVNARLQTTRAEGSVRGTPAGGLQMLYIPLADVVNVGDTVVTSGIGGKFPRGLLLGQVTSTNIDASTLFQEAQVRSLIDFNRLEIVQVIVDFEPVDEGAFATPVP